VQQEALGDPQPNVVNFLHGQTCRICPEDQVHTAMSDHNRNLDASSATVSPSGRTSHTPPAILSVTRYKH